MKICVLNCSNPTGTLHLELDSYEDYRRGRASCFEDNKPIKQVKSWHSWTYSLETEFFVYGKEKWQVCFQYDAVIVLVNRNIEDVIPIVKKLKLMKKKVAICFHEGCSDLINGSGIKDENLPQRWAALYNIVKEADMFINIFSQMDAFFVGWLGANKVKHVSHAAPIDQEFFKSFWVPCEQRKCDILIGTRTFSQRIPRNTMITLGVANKFANEGKRVVYISEDGNLRDVFDKMGLNKIELAVGPFDWISWLKIIADSKVVAHSDQSLNLGQIHTDCALMNVQCVGSSTHFALLDDVDDGNDAGYLEHLIRTHRKEPSWELREVLHPDYVKKQLMEIFE